MPIPLSPLISGMPLQNSTALETIVGTVYADKYTNLIYEIGIAKIIDGVPTMSGSVSMASDYGFGA